MATVAPVARHVETAAAPRPVDPDGATGLLASATARAYLVGCSGDITAAVFDVATGKTSLWRPGVLEYTASIVKVDILATLLRQHQQAGTPLSTAQSWLAAVMIEQSDNDAATQLWDEIGQQDGLARFDSQLGLDDTFPGTDGHWGGTLTTAADQVELLRAIVLPNAVLDPESRSYELGLMENIEPSEAWGISAGVPVGVTLALKNGWLPLEYDGDWQINSIGWVDGDGRDYILAVLTKNNPTEANGIETVQGLSELVWDALAP
jgi:Beta-lactamase enzyme family